MATFSILHTLGITFIMCMIAPQAGSTYEFGTVAEIIPPIHDNTYVWCSKTAYIFTYTIKSMWTNRERTTIIRIVPSVAACIPLWY